jgi:hypothetical protein
MIRIKKVSKFSVGLVGLLLLLAFLVIISFRGIFSAISTSREMDQEFLDSQTPRIDKDSLNRAYDWSRDKKVTTLDLRE